MQIVNSNLKYCNMIILDVFSGLRAVEDVLKPPGSLLASDRSKAVVFVLFLINVI